MISIDYYLLSLILFSLSSINRNLPLHARQRINSTIPQLRILQEKLRCPVRIKGSISLLLLKLTLYLPRFLPLVLLTFAHFCTFLPKNSTLLEVSPQPPLEIPCRGEAERRRISLLRRNPWLKKRALLLRNAQIWLTLAHFGAFLSIFASFSTTISSPP